MLLISTITNHNASLRMKYLKSTLTGPLALSLLVAASTAGISPLAWSQPKDVLERPALMSSRASRSVLLAVARADQRLVSVGNGGNVLLSDDNGKTWRQVPVPVRATLTNVFFVDAKNGWAVGHSGIVLASHDGGETWEKQLDGKLAAKINADLVKESGDDFQRRNAEQLVQDGPDKPFLGVYFADANRGWVVGAYGIAFTTEDGGKHWQSIIPNVENRQLRHLYSIQAVAGKFYITGEQGTLLASTDGTKFSAVKTPYAGTYFGLVSTADQQLLVYGLRGNVYRLDGTGDRWGKVEVGAPLTVTAGARLGNGDVVLADETGRILKSHDSGKTFQALSIPNPSYISSVAIAADGAIVLAGARGMTRIDASTLTSESKR
ncbi:WD40/YVTN/BNR-like repeat-containing protein [Duganella sp. Dugasp56]|uniref:WD40/YVTN/BNR-like repeat-containing protein n=1 Tax=Duganella sp. Dugasp56 TaxID=3243046 RepID=UPI0039AEA3DB